MNDDLIFRLVELGGTAGILWFVILRVEKSIKENTQAINALSTTIAVLLDRHIQQQMETKETVRQNTATMVQEISRHRH